MPGLRIKNPNYLKELKRKFLEKFKVNENGCWIWQRGCHKQGYGNCKYKRKTLLAHRLSWMLFKGELKDTDVVCHKCDITACVNPDHLFKGTTKDNVHDCMRKKKRSSSYKRTTS